MDPSDARSERRRSVSHGHAAPSITNRPPVANPQYQERFPIRDIAKSADRIDNQEREALISDVG